MTADVNKVMYATKEASTIKNIDIRFAIQKAGFRNWQIAESLNITENHFSRMLRHELSEERKQEVFAAIERLKEGATGEC